MSNYGWDFQDHTLNHLRIPILSDKKFRNSFNEMNKIFKNLGLKKTIAIAAPYGDISKSKRKIASEYRSIIRNTRCHTKNERDYILTDLDRLTLQNIHTISIDMQDENKDSRLKYAYKKIDETKALNGDLVVYFHRPLIENPKEDYYGKLEYILDVVEYAEKSGLQFKTIKDLYSESLILK